MTRCVGCVEGGVELGNGRPGGGWDEGLKAGNGFGQAAVEIGCADEGFDDVGKGFGGHLAGLGRLRWEKRGDVVGTPFVACERLGEDVFVEAGRKGAAGEIGVGDDVVFLVG